MMHDLFVSLKERRADTETADWTYQRDEFSSTGWYFEEGAFLELASNLLQFKDEIRPFIESFSLDQDLLEELIKYQFSLIRQLNTKCITVKSKYNFYEFFERGKPLEKAQCELRITAKKNVDNWADYAREFVWFGKRYSATLMVNPRNLVEFKR